MFLHFLNKKPFTSRALLFYHNRLYNSFPFCSNNSCLFLLLNLYDQISNTWVYLVFHTCYFCRHVQTEIYFNTTLKFVSDFPYLHMFKHTFPKYKTLRFFRYSKVPLFPFKLNFFTVFPGLLLAFSYLITLLKIFLSFVSDGSLINFKYLYLFRDYHSYCPLILFFVVVDHIDHNYFLFAMSNQSLLIINYHHFVYVNL